MSNVRVESGRLEIRKKIVRGTRVIRVSLMLHILADIFIIGNIRDKLWPGSPVETEI